MKKSTIAAATAIALAFALLLPHAAFAQRTPLACQGEAAGGLKWESDRWVGTRFHESKFVLVQDGPSLTSDSVAKRLNGLLGSDASCIVVDEGRVSCTDKHGGSMVFDPKTKRGAIASLYDGATARTGSILRVEAFVCQSF